MNDVASHSTPPRKLGEGLWWLPNCSVVKLEGVLTHVHASLYLIKGSEKTLLWDCGAPIHWPGVLRSLKQVLGERTLDYIAPSHPEVPHCGSAQLLMDQYPKSRLIGDMRDYPLYFPDYTDRMVDVCEGARVDLGDRDFVFVKAVIRDLPSTLWGYDVKEQVLFVSDGFGYSHFPASEDAEQPTHRPGTCSNLSSELAAPPGPDQVVWITKAALYWTRFVKLDRYRSAFAELRRQYPTKFIAPAHGAVIDDAATIEAVWNALGDSYAPAAAAHATGAAVHQRM